MREIYRRAKTFASSRRWHMFSAVSIKELLEDDKGCEGAASPD